MGSTPSNPAADLVHFQVDEDNLEPKVYQRFTMIRGLVTNDNLVVRLRYLYCIPKDAIWSSWYKDNQNHWILFNDNEDVACMLLCSKTNGSAPSPIALSVRIHNEPDKTTDTDKMISA